MENFNRPALSIKNWAEDDRPREKLISKGSEHLSNAELVAILINNGSKKKSAIELAKEVMTLANNDVNALGKLSLQQLQSIGGIGPAKAVTLFAAFELGRRRQQSKETDLRKIDVVKNSKSLALYLQARTQDYSIEKFIVVYLNQANRILECKTISEGGITGTVADPRTILRHALELNSTNIILSHNHPSGNLTPSKADENLTQKIKTAAAFMDIKVLDHIIVSERGYFSFADEGMI